MTKASVLKFHPLTEKRWKDFEMLFGPRGACGGCWCMWWRSTRKVFEERQGDGNREAMRAIVRSGKVPGILGYDAGTPVAWCSVAPRDDFSSLNRSRVLKKLDETPVWSIVCMYIAKSRQRQGLTHVVIRAAVDHARRHDGTMIEAYPTVPRSENVPPYSSFMGLPAMFEKAGFVECARPSTAKCIMRFQLGTQ